jgi:hypothetical protein
MGTFVKLSKFRFLMQAYQDPPLGCSTHKTYWICPCELLKRKYKKEEKNRKNHP